MGILRLKQIQKMRRWEDFQINKAWEHLDKCGRLIDFKIRLGPYEGIKNAWKNQPCVVVGAGPSLKGFDFKLLDGKHTIGTNHLIEDYDKFEWFIFLDNRFLKKTTYNIEKFRGKIFQSNKCQLLPEHLDVVRFRPQSWKEKPTEFIRDGLYNGCLTALCALHLAIISGANPIYMIGIDCGGGNFMDYHYKKDYTAASHYEKKYNKYVGTANYFKHFSPWSNRIRNLSKISNVKWFPYAEIDELKKIKKIRIIQQPKICHIISMKNMQEMGDISRQVFNRSYGNHIYSNINNERHPKADIYLLECFIQSNEKFINFKKPPGSKVVSIIHSSSKCNAAKCSDEVITLTNAWKMVIRNRGQRSKVIHAGIDVNNYKYSVDYSNKNFGRITRYSPGKVHNEWFNIALNVLNKYKDSKCIMYMQKINKAPKHQRFIVDNTIKINEHDKKAQKLANLSLFCDMHNTFIETFSLALLEAMACGLPIIMYSKAPQHSMWEVMGNVGIVCASVEGFQKKIIEILPDVERKKQMGQESRERAKAFSVEVMIKKYNKIFKELLK